MGVSSSCESIARAELPKDLADGLILELSELGPEELENVVFVEKAVLACPLPTKSFIEALRWNPLALAFLTPLWSCTGDHWWSVVRTEDGLTHYAAQFCCIDGVSRVATLICKTLSMVVADGLQYRGSQWWFEREWVPCHAPRSKADMDRLVSTNNVVSSEYSWASNNCQHFSACLHDDGEFAA